MKKKTDARKKTAASAEERRPEPELSLFKEEDLVSRVELARIPDGAMTFNVPVSPLTVRLLLKERKGYGAVMLAQASSLLNKKTQVVEGLPRSWFVSASAYLGPGTKNKGGMQSDLTRMWPDFRPFYVKIKKEDGQR